MKIIWKNNLDCLSKFLTVVCNFLQCDYCQIENVSMDFSSPLVTENSFQITRLRLVIWKEFSVTCGEEKPILTFPPDSNLSLSRSGFQVILGTHTKLEEDFRWKLKYWAISYIIFSDFSCRIGICNFWNDPLGEFEGQTVLGQHGPSPSACFGSNKRWFEPFVTAETGRRTWSMVP